MERVGLPWVCAVGDGLVLCGSSPGPIGSNGQESREFLIKAVRGSICWSAIKTIPWLHTAKRRGGIGGLSSLLCLRESQYGALYSRADTGLWKKDKMPVAVRPARPGNCRTHATGTVCCCVRLAGGDRLLALLTSRVVPLKASGVVSFSYRHRRAVCHQLF
ncbi:MAG: hypothetical protein IPM88_21060 [Nitrospira sp.]|nr:hypothetical protein [Nitrospira sp.]